ncbi:hypothetical protein SALBM311S_11318 [Streptomyces alboniger]
MHGKHGDAAGATVWQSQSRVPTERRPSLLTYWLTWLLLAAGKPDGGCGAPSKGGNPE